MKRFNKYRGVTPDNPPYSEAAEQYKIFKRKHAEEDIKNGGEYK